MITFIVSLLALVLGYFLYGRYVDRMFGPDDRQTPAISEADGVDFMVLPTWKVFMIQFLNIAGTGPIFGAIMGAKYGPSAYLWIVLGCIFAGATHDYLSGMLSLRNRGEVLPELIGKYLGRNVKNVVLVFSCFLLVMVGTVFVYSPAEILQSFGGSTLFWILAIFIYYIIATFLPVDKIIGKIYPLFAFSLLFMAFALMVMLFVKMPQVPEIWDGLGNMATAHGEASDPIFPCLFITIACGAISGFHATQSPIMARCLKSERMGRKVFYGSMITEGVVALIWATVASYFFYGEPAPGYQILEAAKGYHTSAPEVVNLICNDWLGVVGGILALLGVVAAPITSGDTAFRSARLIVADALGVNQEPIFKRLMIGVPLFIASILMLVWKMENHDGFQVIWQYFGWANQTLSVFTLWMLTVWLTLSGRNYFVTLIPALFMTTVCVTFLCISPQAFALNATLSYVIGIASCVIGVLWFVAWKRKVKVARLTD